jgi:hypothetical protein
MFNIQEGIALDVLHNIACLLYMVCPISLPPKFKEGRKERNGLDGTYINSRNG